MNELNVNKLYYSLAKLSLFNSNFLVQLKRMTLKQGSHYKFNFNLGLVLILFSSLK